MRVLFSLLSWFARRPWGEKTLEEYLAYSMESIRLQLILVKEAWTSTIQLQSYQLKRTRQRERETVWSRVCKRRRRRGERESENEKRRGTAAELVEQKLAEEEAVITHRGTGCQSFLGNGSMNHCGNRVFTANSKLIYFIYSTREEMLDS